MPNVYERIQAFNKNREPQLAALKYKLLSLDPFRFFRGTDHLFYEDLAVGQNWEDKSRIWISGDLHLENFGSYKGDNRVVYFDINDFDEALMAPPTWEVVRLLTSIYVGGQSVNYDVQTAGALCKIYLDAYLQVLNSGKPLVIEKETADGLLAFFLDQVRQRKTRDLVRSRTVQRRDGLQLLIDDQKVKALPGERRQQLLSFFKNWFVQAPGMEKFQVEDVAYRIAGTGSVGLQRYVLLVQEPATGKYRLLDVKEATPSSVLPYVKLAQPPWPSEAARVINLQKRLQHVSPAMLHAVHMEQKDFVLKELQPSADRMDLLLCKGKLNKLSRILETMAHVTASGQLRCTGRQGSDIADDMINFAQQADNWKTAVLDYAARYAQQVHADYEAYCKAYKG
ncbi:DUF2252 domain-containing protein [Chitinophaga parva]|uniref:DUF2252 domain-containing protein n=1 Tax=Chitinophaga parva TaxID=2169414 RepID=A0A2T7BH46_9BACT|nr:DUF2252 family protein [Chitinophaga parva]PUZ25598.1 DUF2252 domain-containing protein [Chitinophaga parva]